MARAPARPQAAGSRAHRRQRRLAPDVGPARRRRLRTRAGARRSARRRGISAAQEPGHLGKGNIPLADCRGIRRVIARLRRRMPCLVLVATGAGRTPQRVAVVALAQSPGRAARGSRTGDSQRHAAHGTTFIGRVAVGAGVSIWRIGDRASFGGNGASHAHGQTVRDARRPQVPARTPSGGTAPAGGMLDCAREHSAIGRNAAGAARRSTVNSPASCKPRCGCRAATAGRCSPRRMLPAGKKTLSPLQPSWPAPRRPSWPD